MNRMLSLASPLVLATVLAGCGGDDDLDSTLTVTNSSTYAFVGIFLSPTTSVSWGADLLGDDILSPGESVVISGIGCDTYDIKIIDEDADECILDNVDLCLDDAKWTIDNTELAACQF